VTSGVTTIYEERSDDTFKTSQDQPFSEKIVCCSFKRRDFFL
jgi:hypothetical protein